MKGALVKRYYGAGALFSYTINTNDLLSSAIYSLRVSYDGDKIVKTVLKK
jgi:hypothetical protein